LTKSPVTAPGKIELKKSPIQCALKTDLNGYFFDSCVCKSIFHLMALRIEQIEYSKKKRKTVATCFLKKVKARDKSRSPLLINQKTKIKEKENLRMMPGTIWFSPN